MSHPASTAPETAPELTSNDTVFSGVEPWETTTTGSAWHMIKLTAPAVIDLAHTAADDNTDDTYLIVYRENDPGVIFTSLSEPIDWDDDGAGNLKAAITVEDSIASEEFPSYYYLRHSSAADAFADDPSAAPIAPVSGVSLTWTVTGGAPPAHGPTTVASLDITAKVVVSFGGAETTPTNVTMVDPWDIDESQQCLAPVDLAFHVRSVVPPTIPPGGVMDPVTGIVTPGTGEHTPLPAPAVRYLVRTSPVFPDPVPLLDPATGRVDRTQFTQDFAQSVVEAAGRLRVVIDGRDVTFFRGPQVKVQDIRLEEPFGSVQAKIDFVAVNPMEAIGSGDLSWLRDGADVDIDLVTPNGTVITLFEGLIPSMDDNLAPKGTGISLTCVGTLFQADYIMNEPPLWETVKDAGAVLAGLFDIPGARYQALDPVATGIPTSERGSIDESRLDRARALLAAMWTDDGGTQWTVKELGGRRFQIALKDRDTSDWTVTAGVAGVNVQLTRDLTQAPNVIKGSGVDEDNNFYSWLKTPSYVPGRNETPFPNNDESDSLGPGSTDGSTDSGNGVSTWQKEMRRLGYNITVDGSFGSQDTAAAKQLQRDAGLQVDGFVGPQTWNATFSTGKNGGNLNGAYHAAITQDPAVEPYTYTASGARAGNNPAYDRNKLRVETWVHFPDGTSKVDAQRSAEAQRMRDADPGYSGTITLTTDPREGSRALIRPGQGITVVGHRGEARRLHIAQVEHNFDSSPFQTTLRVDTQARDAMTLSAVMKRSRDAKNLAKRPQGPKSRSEAASGKPLLDSELVGYVTDTPIFPGLWSKSFVPLGKTGTIVKVDLQASPPVEFVAVLFGSDVKPSFLAANAADPLRKIAVGDGYDMNPFPGDETFEKALDDALWIETWGGPDEPAGYRAPGKSQGGRLTGTLREPCSVAFDLAEPPWGTLLVYASEPTTITGRFYIAPEA